MDILYSHNYKIVYNKSFECKIYSRIYIINHRNRLKGSLLGTSIG